MKGVKLQLTLQKCSSSFYYAAGINPTLSDQSNALTTGQNGIAAENYPSFSPDHSLVQPLHLHLSRASATSPALKSGQECSRGHIDLTHGMCDAKQIDSVFMIS